MHKGFSDSVAAEHALRYFSSANNAFSLNSTRCLGMLDFASARSWPGKDCSEHFCEIKKQIRFLVQNGTSAGKHHLVELLSQPMSFIAVAEAALQHTVASNFTQISAAQAPQCTGNSVLLDERLVRSGRQGEALSGFARRTTKRQRQRSR